MIAPSDPDPGGVDRQLCGWRVRSSIALPELPLWPAADERPVDIVIRLGAAPRQLEDPIDIGPVLQIGRDRICRFALPSVGTFLLRHGAEIIVEPRDGAPQADLRLFLLGSLFGLLCHQRGLMPLHASGVLIGGRAVAFAGPSGIGKSTLAAAFAERGHPVIADDVFVIEPDSPGGTVVRPGASQLRLWRDALEATGGSPAGLERIRGSGEKYITPIGSGSVASPTPLVAIFHLETASLERDVGCIPLSGLRAVSQLRNAVYRAIIADRMGSSARLAEMTLRIASRLPVHARLRQFPRLGQLAATVEAVEAMVAAAA